MSDSGDSGYGNCDYCAVELTNPYWKCPVCINFKCCCDCFFILEPKPNRPPHYAKHGLEIVLDSNVPSDDESDIDADEDAVPVDQRNGGIMLSPNPAPPAPVVQQQHVVEDAIEHNPPSDDDLNSNVEESDALSSAHSSTVSSCSSDEDSTSETVDNLSV